MMTALFHKSLFTPLRLLAAALLCMLYTHASAHAGSIAVFAPLSGDYAELGQRFKAGAELAVSALGSDHQVIFLDSKCDAEHSITQLATLNDTPPDLVAGFYCSDAAKAVATSLVSRKTPVLVSAARSVRLIKDREREQWNLWRLAPGDDYPVKKTAAAISLSWKDIPFAVVDDGTIYGRSFTDTLRIELDELGLKPQFSDTFRAAQSTQAGLLRRLQRAGVSAAFVASATTEDLQTIASNASSIGVDIKLMTTEALSVLPFLQDASDVQAGLKIVAWPHEKDAELEEQLIGNSTPSERAVYQGYATLQIALEAIDKIPNDNARAFTAGQFDTVLGRVGFNADGTSTFNPYRVLEWNGDAFVEPAGPETQ